MTMQHFTYVTDTDVWIAVEHVVSVRPAEVSGTPIGESDYQPVTLIRTVDGEQFAVRGLANDVASMINA